MTLRSKAAALFLGVAWASLICLPAEGQTLGIPLESDTRVIRTQTLFHELFTDFFSESDGTTYVQTGDIPAMWLRDSAAQTIPYLRFVRRSSAFTKCFWA